MQIRPKTNATKLDWIIIILVVSAFLFLAGYNIGLAVGRRDAIPRDSTPTLDASALNPVRFIVTHRDTLRSGLVIEVVKDLIWNNATVTVKYFGNELATAMIDK